MVIPTHVEATTACVNNSFKTDITWQFWEVNSLLTRWDDASQKYKYPSVKINLELPYIFIVKMGFQNGKNEHW